MSLGMALTYVAVFALVVAVMALLRKGGGW